MAKASDYDPRVLKLFDGYVHGHITRREFLDRATAFTAAGMTSAALLASLAPDYALAEQVSPDDKTIANKYVKYGSPKGAGVMNGYLSRPAVMEHRLPGVVVIHENRGLNPYIEDVTRRLAVAGFLAYAPDALTPLGGYPGNDDEGRVLQRQRDADEMVEDFKAAVEFLQGHPDCTGKVGAVGFCFGGGMVMRLAVLMPELTAGVPFYGRHPSAEDAESVKAPLMIHHGELDERVNASWPEFEKGLKAADANYVQYVYEDANHGFHNDTTPRYDEAAAALAWSRTVAHFEEHLQSDG
ncbi:MAG: dienelactone hydrolase family protein [Pseudomonadota bacterium]